MNFPNMNGGGFKNKPRALMCYICGREFGTASLHIHIKACIQKWEAQENLKPKKERRPLPQPPKEFGQVVGGAGNGKLDWNEIENYNKQANEKWNEEALLKCEFCNRTFLPERMPIHRKVCTQEKPFKPLPGAGAGKDTSDANSLASTTSNSSKSSMNSNQISQTMKPSAPSSKMEGSNFGGSGGGGASTMGKPMTKSLNVDDMKLGGGAKLSNGPTEEYQEEIELVSCDICGRNFAADRISRHTTACAKAAKGDAKHQKKVAKAEAKLQEVEAFKAKEEKIKAKTTKWRAQHEELQKAMEYMKKVKAVEQAGGDPRTLDPPPTSNTDHLVPCPYCGRKFAQQTAERHIPKCKDVINKPKPPPTKSSVSSSMTMSSNTKLTTNTTASKGNPYASTEFEKGALKGTANTKPGGFGSNQTSLASKPTGKSTYDSPNPVSSKSSTLNSKSAVPNSSTLTVSATKIGTSANSNTASGNSTVFKAYQAKKTGGAFNY